MSAHDYHADAIDALAPLLRPTGEGDHPDPHSPTNARRADWGEYAMETDPDYGQNDDETSIGDVITNLLHLCDRGGLCKELILARAFSHYRAEAVTS